jgi:hypothetical protein
MKQKLFIVAILTGIVSISVAAIHIQARKYRNLKILPADISEQKLDSFMHVYCRALNVECNFCHKASLLTGGELDFSSDAEPMKNNARDMMRMVIDINKTYFNYDTTKHAIDLNVISCKNCHQGHVLPPTIN